VRKAISLAINRQGIIDSILEGQGIASGQLVPEGFFGSIPGRPADPYDPDAAKALLAEAGYPDGFKMTIHGSKGRYYADDQWIQAIGQMLTRIGIKTAVEVVPRSNYTGGNTHDYSLALYGWGSDTSEASSPLTSLLHTRDEETGYGASNRGHYSNPELDKLIEEAKSIMDDGQRETALQEATEVAMNDYGIITLWFQVNAWASDKNISYNPRRDEFTLAVSAHPE
jgi:peptide/nickel transport system substrate-binding protein